MSGPGIATIWDGFGRPLSSTSSMGGHSRTLGYQHDPNGNRTRLTHPDGTYFAYDHDGLGRLVRIRENGGTYVASYAYDAAGRPWTKTFPGAVESYLYDGASRLSSLGHNLAGTAFDQGVTFAYNPASQIVSRTRSNDAYAAAAPAPASVGYQVNGLNQYAAVAGVAYAYDGNGNLRSDGTRSFAYDAENRLVSMGGPTWAAPEYDPLGRLWKLSATGTTILFLYDGDELVGEYDGSGNITRRYVHGSAVDDPVAWYEGPGLAGRRSLMADHQGSIVAVADSTGNKLAINGYDAWGVPNPSNVGRFQYTGQAWVPELGLYYYKARLYSPTLGRFLQTDPVGYEDQINLYAYVGNDPVNLVDAKGQQAVVPRDDNRRVIVIYPQKTHEHVMRRHGPNGPAPDRYNAYMSKEEAGELASNTMIDAQEQGTVARELGYGYVYESKQAGWFSSLGDKGQDYNRVTTRPFGMLGDPDLIASAEKEMLGPKFDEAVAAAALSHKGTGPIEVEVIVSQYPVREENLRFGPR